MEITKKKRILIVDDESSLRNLVKIFLESFGHETETAKDGFEALEKVTLDIDLVLLDVQMPGMDGFEVVKKIRANPLLSDIPICMITGETSRTSQLRAVETGANDFICKPMDQTELKIRSDSLLKQKETQDIVKQYYVELEDKVKLRTASLNEALIDMAAAQEEAKEAHLDTIDRLALASEYKDKATSHHIQRVGLYCEIISCALGLPESEVETIKLASPMHDVGKIGIADGILLKPGNLNDEEMAMMKTHTTIGAKILDGSSSKLLQAGKIIALTHHEKWDGSGYPNNISGENIPLIGRICALADVFDALSFERPYKKAFSREKVLEIIKEGRGTHFDPNLTDIFFENLDAIFQVYSKFE
jgi:cyclic di-GMP phosphodiesterase